MKTLPPTVFSSRAHLPKPQRTRQHYTTEFLASQVKGTKEKTTGRQKGWRMEALIGNMSTFFCLHVKKTCSKRGEEQRV
jgi:hypothetical protein